MSFEVDLDKYNFSVSTDYNYVMPRGLNEGTVREISRLKNEPQWMEDLRLKGLREFVGKKMPSWGPDLSDLDLNKVIYYAKPTGNQAKSWEDLPPSIKETFERLGVPEAERKFLAGVGAQFESEVVYHNLKKELESQGVIFSDMDTAVREYPELVKEYYSKIIPVSDNKFSALTYAVWSGGSFVYVPKGVRLEKPVYAYFRLNAPDVGNFERTLIVAEEDSYVHYIEGCTAPLYSGSTLHGGVVEIVAKKGAHVRYTTIQNWSRNVFNLVTQRAHVYENGKMEWVDGNMGSKITMKYPSIYLLGRGASGIINSMSIASKNQIIDSGGKIYHNAPDTSSTITSKGISMKGGSTTYRGLVYVARNAENAKSAVRCDSLMMDENSRSNTYPYEVVNDNSATVVHEASAGRVGQEQLFYLMSRGLKEPDALSLIVMGYMDQFTKEIPVDFATELYKLISLELIGAVG
ncbi:MAG: Fe-S cluster assembly protein SufB [Nitrososphaeria archaeon]